MQDETERNMEVDDIFGGDESGNAQAEPTKPQPMDVDGESEEVEEEASKRPRGNEEENEVTPEKKLRRTEGTSTQKEPKNKEPAKDVMLVSGDGFDFRLTEDGILGVSLKRNLEHAS